MPVSKSNGSLQPVLLRQSGPLSPQRFDLGSPPTSPTAVTARPVQNRPRATSLLGPQSPAAASPVKESRFGLLRSNSKQKVPFSSAAGGQSTVGRPTRPTSLLISSTDGNRYSFGLPKISADASKSMFDEFGVSPIKPVATDLSAASESIYTQRSGETWPLSGLNRRGKQLPETPAADTSLDRDPIAAIPAASLSGIRRREAIDSGVVAIDGPRPEAPATTVTVDEGRSAGVSSGTLPVANHPDESLPAGASPALSLYIGNSPIASPATVPRSSPAMIPRAIDAAEGWRNEQVLYQCACVADL